MNHRLEGAFLVDSFCNNAETVTEKMWLTFDIKHILENRKLYHGALVDTR